VYYNSTRFDWSSQIGNVRIGDRVLFGDRFWRGAEHDPANPEAAVGLASEFGCGDYGDVCAKGTLNHGSGSRNGVLNYDEAAVGETFVKIGVGKLTKPAEERYNPFFNYAFSEFPHWDYWVWNGTVQMAQEVFLNAKWGYHLQNTIRVVGTEIHQETELTNTGTEGFSTPHYSHNFLSFDRRPIGPPWRLSMVPDVSSKIEPGVGSWSQPIGDYFGGSGDTIWATRAVPAGVKVKAEYVGEPNVDAGDAWTAQYEGLTIHSEQTNPEPKLYAYNVYIEEATLSPEPIQRLSLAGGQAVKWTRKLTFSLDDGH
jgi:hypothetical protein